jgi:hypothetical protein
MNVNRNRPQHAEAEHPEGIGGAALSRRGVLGALAALPVLYGIGSAAPALGAVPKLAATARQPDSASKATDDLVRRDDLLRGVERRYNAPQLAPGSRLVLPSDIKAVPVKDYYRRPHLAWTKSAWPHMRAADGTTVDASIVPEHGAPTRIAILSGFTEGWYELTHASGRADRVTWDARKFPFLWFYGEYGATGDAPYRNRFYTLALQPFSRNPYSRNTLAA